MKSKRVTTERPVRNHHSSKGFSRVPPACFQIQTCFQISVARQVKRQASSDRFKQAAADCSDHSGVPPGIAHSSLDLRATVIMLLTEVNNMCIQVWLHCEIYVEISFKR